jgi:acetyl esterase
MALQYQSFPGDIDRAVADDNAAILRTFEHLEDTRGDRRILADQLSFALNQHAIAIEQVVLPLIAEKYPQLDQAVRQAQQHDKARLAVLDAADPDGAEFMQALARLIGSGRQHLVDLETDVLPALRSVVLAAGGDEGPDELRRLGREFAAAKRRAPTLAHPDVPDSPTASRILGAAAAFIDKLKDRSSGRVDRLETDASGLLDPDAQAVLEAWAALDPLPLETLDPDEARAQPTLANAVTALLELRYQSDGEQSAVAVDDRSAPGAEGDLPVRIYTPVVEETPTEGLPVLVFFDGPDWVRGGDPRSAIDLAPLAELAGAVVVSAGYRQAPEHPFPAAHDDALSIARWAYREAQGFGGDPTRIALGGQSAGAALAASTALQLAASSEPVPLFLLLVSPLVTIQQVGESFEDSADAKPVGRATLTWSAAHSFAKPEDAADARVELLGAPTETLGSLPTTLVLTAARDPLRSQGEEFAFLLDEAGVAAEATRYEGMPNGFFGLAAVVGSAAKAQRQAADALKAALADATTSPEPVPSEAEPSDAASVETAPAENVPAETAPADAAPAKAPPADASPSES